MWSVSYLIRFPYLTGGCWLQQPQRCTNDWAYFLCYRLSVLSHTKLHLLKINCRTLNPILSWFINQSNVECLLVKSNWFFSFYFEIKSGEFLSLSNFRTVDNFVLGRGMVLRAHCFHKCSFAHTRTHKYSYPPLLWPSCEWAAAQHWVGELCFRRLNWLSCLMCGEGEKWGRKYESWQTVISASIWIMFKYKSRLLQE